MNDDIVNRLRCKYPLGPIMPNGEPEFGWRDFSGHAPEGMVLPTPLMLEAAIVIEAKEAEIARLREALLDAVANLAGAASAYRAHAKRHQEIRPKSTPDAFFTTRQDDFDRAVERCRAALSGEGK